MHPVLYPDSILNPEILQILRIVDWQSAGVATFFYYTDVPGIYTDHGPLQGGWVVPERPKDFDTLNVEEQSKIDND